MFNRLYIKNFAIISELEIKFHEGLNIITGETGSGKTLLVRAIGYLLGKRFDNNEFKNRDNNTIIEGEFVIDNEHIVIRRIFIFNKPSRTFINDIPITLPELKNQVKFLIDIFTQHEHQNLLDPNKHLDYLDLYGNYLDVYKKYNSIYVDYLALKLELESLSTEQKDIKDKMELYSFQMSEIEILKPFDTKYEENLNHKHKIISNSKEINEKFEEILEISSKINKNISDLSRVLNSTSHLNTFLSTINTRIDNISIEISDVSNDLEIEKNNIKISPLEYEKINEDIQILEDLKRKYGGSFESIIKYYNKIKSYLEQYNNIDDNISKIKSLILEKEKDLLELSQTLTKKRKLHADKFVLETKKYLNKIGMDKAEIKFHFDKIEEFSSKGTDDCEIKFCSNGSELKPLRSIISGGELSRLMLAMKLIMNYKDMTKTILFDEIDSGISGQIAHNVGTMLNLLGKSQQIICITHLSQIASLGEHHYKVMKYDNSNNMIECSVDLLNKDDRVEEIASLISGEELSQESFKQAKKLLNYN